ncbi:MAG: hypothetical protein NT130_03410 [Candidatus Micrarchaeota archaeon]|nr:hypothetical protein [Candidatus Micrarchaeota archaeon]
MVFVHKQPEEKPKFTEIRGGLLERFQDRFKKYNPAFTITEFGRNQAEVEDFGRLLAEFKNTEEKITMNDIGIGLVRRKAVYFPGAATGVAIGKGVYIGDTFIMKKMKRDYSFEPFELLNQVRQAGIPPERFVLNAVDRSMDTLLAVKSTKTLEINTSRTRYTDEELSSLKEYLQKFFPEFHGEEKGSLIPVKIPEDYRKRIKCYALDLNDGPAPEAHITFALPQTFTIDEKGLRNLVESTRKGGYLITDGFEKCTAEGLKRFNLSRVHSHSETPIYQVITT